MAEDDERISPAGLRPSGPAPSSSTDTDSPSSPAPHEAESESGRWFGSTAASDGPTSERSSQDPAELHRASVTLVDADQLAPLFFAVLFVSVIVALVYVLHTFIADLVVAFILVSMFRRPFEWLCRRTRGHVWLASGITTVLILVLILGPVLGMGYTIASQALIAYDAAAGNLGASSAGMLDSLVDLGLSLGLPFSRGMVLTYAQDLAASLQGVVLSFGESVIGNALSITIHLATVLVIVFYLLVDGEKLRRFLFALSPLPDDEDALIADTFLRVSRGVVVGNGLASVMQGVLGGLAFWAVGLPSPVLWGTVMSLFAFLPLVGISVVAVPATLLLLYQGQTAEAIGFAVFCIAQGLLIENVVKTKMIGSAMRMHDLLVFLSILGGIAAFGIIGLVYGPLIAMLFMTLDDLYDQVYRPKLAMRLAGRPTATPRPFGRPPRS